MVLPATNGYQRTADKAGLLVYTLKRAEADLHFDHRAAGLHGAPNDPGCPGANACQPGSLPQGRQLLETSSPAWSSTKQIRLPHSSTSQPRFQGYLQQGSRSSVRLVDRISFSVESDGRVVASLQAGGLQWRQRFGLQWLATTRSAAGIHDDAIALAMLNALMDTAPAQAVRPSRQKVFKNEYIRAPGIHAGNPV